MNDEREGSHGEPAPAGALVPCEEARAGAAGGVIRPLATFIAQVLACRTRLPDFRRHRRAPAPAAAAAYAAAPPTRAPRFERHL